MGVVSVKPHRPASLERDALRAALKMKAEAEQELAAATSAYADFERKFGATEDAYYAAIREAENAKSHLADLLRANGGSEQAVAQHAAEFEEPHPRARLRKAEEALADARENFNLGEEGHAVIRGRVANAEVNLSRSIRKCEGAAAAVEITKYPELLAEAQALFVDLYRRRHVLLRLARNFPDIQHRQRSEDAERLGGYLDANDRLPSVFNGDGVKNDEHQRLKQEALAPWDACRIALMADADASLPASRSAVDGFLGVP